jgi:hypothetical protein
MSILGKRGLGHTKWVRQVIKRRGIVQRKKRGWVKGIDGKMESYRKREEGSMVPLCTNRSLRDSYRS